MRIQTEFSGDNKLKENKLFWRNDWHENQIKF